jgi:pseudaminic acid cytidylyltransferase
MNLCVIPARGGSKRIPRKNIKKFNDKPIIAYSIEAALRSKCFDQVIVSTDDQEVANIAVEYGANVPFLRPTELSDDYSGTIPVVQHAINWMEGNNKIQNVCCLYATAPFVRPEILSDAYQKMLDSNTDFCFSVTSYAFPIQRALKIKNQVGLQMFYPENFDKRSQDLEEAYHDAGQFYWGKVESFKRNLPLFSNASYPYLLPRYLVQDIDTMEDWIRAEAMFKALKSIKQI